VIAFTAIPKFMLPEGFFATKSVLNVPAKIILSQTGEITSDFTQTNYPNVFYSGDLFANVVDLNPGINDINFSYKNYSTKQSGVVSKSIRYFDGLGKALLFDGVDDKAELNLNGNIPAESFTISMWVRLNTTANRNILNYPGLTTLGWKLTTDSNSCPVFKTQGDIGSVGVAGASIIKNSWTHLTITFDNSTKTLKMFQNGELKSSVDIQGDLFPPDNSKVGVLGDKLDGLIDELRIYNVAHTDVFIKATLFSPSITNEPSAVGIFDFDSYSQIIKDKNQSSAFIRLGKSEVVDTQDPRSRFSAYVAKSQLVLKDKHTIISTPQATLKIPVGALDKDRVLKIVVSDGQTEDMSGLKKVISPIIKIFPVFLSAKELKKYITLSFKINSDLYSSDTIFGLRQDVGESVINNQTVFNFESVDKKENTVSLITKKAGRYQSAVSSEIDREVVNYTIPGLAIDSNSSDVDEARFYQLDVTKTGSAPYLLNLTGSLRPLASINSWSPIIQCYSYATQRWTSYYQYNFPIKFTSLTAGNNYCLNKPFQLFYDNFSWYYIKKWPKASLYWGGPRALGD
jgi:hypothetical protein